MVQTAIDKMKVDLLLIFINHSLKLFCAFVYLFIVSRPTSMETQRGRASTISLFSTMSPTTLCSNRYIFME